MQYNDNKSRDNGDNDGAQKAAMYVRMSTEHQKYSTENQEKQIREYADQNNIDIITTYHDDGKSGLTIKNRDGMQRLLSDVQSGQAPFELILVLDTTRWGRYQNFDQSGHYDYLCASNNIKVIYVTEPYLNDGSQAAGVMKVVQRMGAADYSARLSDKVFRGQCTLIQKGFRQGGPPGFGLRRQMIDEHGKDKTLLERGQQKSLQTDRVILVPGPEDEVKTVHWMYEMFVDEGWSERQIADDLNRRNILTDFERAWTRGTVHQILTNEPIQTKGKPMSKTQTKPKVAPKKPDPKKDAEAKPQTAPEAKKPEADKPKAELTKKVTKKQQMIDMLKRPDGATDAEMVKAFNWKGKHVARGQRSILAKEYRDKNMALMISKFTRTPSGDIAYKIEPIVTQSKTEG